MQDQLIDEIFWSKSKEIEELVEINKEKFLDLLKMVMQHFNGLNHCKISTKQEENKIDQNVLNIFEFVVYLLMLVNLDEDCTK